MSVERVAIFWVVNASSGEKSCLQISIPTGSGAGGEGGVSHSLKPYLGWKEFSFRRPPNLFSQWKYEPQQAWIFPFIIFILDDSGRFYGYPDFLKWTPRFILFWWIHFSTNKFSQINTYLLFEVNFYTCTSRNTYIKFHSFLFPKSYMSLMTNKFSLIPIACNDYTHILFFSFLLDRLD